MLKLVRETGEADKMMEEEESEHEVIEDRVQVAACSADSGGRDGSVGFGIEKDEANDLSAENCKSNKEQTELALELQSQTSFNKFL